MQELKNIDSKNENKTEQQRATTKIFGFHIQEPTDEELELQKKKNQKHRGVFLKIMIALLFFGYYQLVLFEIDFVNSFGNANLNKDFFYYLFNWDTTIFGIIKAIFLICSISVVGSYFKHLQGNELDFIDKFLCKPFKKIKKVEISKPFSFIGLSIISCMSVSFYLFCVLSIMESSLLNQVYDFNNNPTGEFNYKTVFLNVYILVQIIMISASLKYKTKISHSCIFISNFLTALIFFVFFVKDILLFTNESTFLNYSQWVSKIIDLIPFYSMSYLLISFCVIALIRLAFFIIKKTDESIFNKRKEEHEEKLKNGEDSILIPYRQSIEFEASASDWLIPFVSLTLNSIILYFAVFSIFANNTYEEEVKINGQVVRYQDSVHISEENTAIVEGFIEHSLGNPIISKSKNKDLIYLVKLADHEGKEKELINAFTNVRLNHVKTKIDNKEKIIDINKNDPVTMDTMISREINRIITKGSDYTTQRLFLLMLNDHSYQDAVDFIEDKKRIELEIVKKKNETDKENKSKGIDSSDEIENTIVASSDLKYFLLLLNETQLAKVDLKLWDLEGALVSYNGFNPEVKDDVTVNDLNRILNIFDYERK